MQRRARRQFVGRVHGERDVLRRHPRQFVPLASARVKRREPPRDFARREIEQPFDVVCAGLRRLFKQLDVPRAKRRVYSVRFAR